MRSQIFDLSSHVDRTLCRLVEKKMSRRKGKKINKGRFAGIPFVMIRHPVFRELNPAALSVWLGIASRYNGYNDG